MMTRDEYQVEQEYNYDKWAAKFPEAAQTYKTYLGWINAGRQVAKGSVAKNAKVKVCIGTWKDIDGEDVPRIVHRYVGVFHVEQTYPRRPR